MILILWRTNMLRLTRLRVIDEVANGLSYYDYTFFNELPRIYCAIEDELARQAPADAGKRIASFLRVGSWIGGDRDGNPYVTAEVLSETMRLQSAAALGHYLEELHELGGELSMSDGLVPVSPALAALAERSTDTSSTRRDEPYRRAIAGIYSRLAKTARELDHVVAARRPLIDAEPYSSAAEFAADLATIDESLRGQRLGDHRARPSEGADSRRRRVRLPSRAARPAAEFRRPRAHRRRTLRHRQPRLRLSRARRGRAHRAADARARHAAAAGLAVRRLQRGDRRRTGGVPHRRGAAPDLRPGRDPHQHHLQDAVGLRSSRAGAAAEGGRARLAPRAVRRSISCRCSRRSTTCAPASA